jgi:hypothetical protein
MPPTNSQAGVPLPLPDAFDYVAWMTPPPDVDIPVLMDVKARNKRNIVIDTFNNTSIDLTRAYMEAALQGTLAAGQDVGPKLKAYFRYTEDELETLVVDTDYFALVSPSLSTSRWPFQRTTHQEKTGRGEEGRRREGEV